MKSYSFIEGIQWGNISHSWIGRFSVCRCWCFPTLIYRFDSILFEEVFIDGIWQADSKMYMDEQGLSVGDSQKTWVYKMTSGGVGDLAEVAGHLPGKPKVLNSTPRNTHPLKWPVEQKKCGTYSRSLNSREKEFLTASCNNLDTSQKPK